MRPTFSLRILLPIFLTYFIDNFGLAIVYPIFTPLFLKPHYELFSAETATFFKLITLGLLIATFPIAQFFGAPLFGGLSDQAGRKKVFLITILGGAMGYLLTGVGIAMRSLPCMWIGRGCTGFFAGNATLCLATIADVCLTDHDRSKYFGWISATGCISFILAIMTGGIFSDLTSDFFFSPSLPFFITAALSLMNWVSMYLFFQDSHAPTSSHKFSFRQRIGHLSDILRKQGIRIIYLTYFLFALAWTTSMQFLSTVLIENFKNTTINKITITFVCISLIWGLVNFTINPILSKHIRPPVIWCFSLFFLGMILLFSFPPLHVFISYVCFFLGAAFFAALAWTNGQTTVSLQADASLQGKVLGINQSVSALAYIIGPIIGGVIAAIKSDLIPLVTGACGILGAILLFYTKIIKTN